MTFILFLISLLTRLLFLYFGYPSITNDEADYFLNSYLLAKTGSDIHLQKFFLTSGILNATSSVPVYLGSIFFFFLDKSVIAGRLPYVLLNSLTPVIFYLIINKLTKNKMFSLIGFIVFNFSPWFSYLSSFSAIDSPTAMFFYLSSIYILLTSLKRKWKYALFILFSFLSFNSYMGIKTIFFLLLLIALIAEAIYQKRKLDYKKIVKYSYTSLALFAVFFIISWVSPSSSFFKNRLKEKLLPLNMNFISLNVDRLRDISKGPFFIRKIIHNKLTVTFKFFVERYVQGFNPYFLFVKGDPDPLYGTNYFGLFYIFDMIFLLLGIIFFRRVLGKNTIAALPFVLLLFTAPLIVGLMLDPAAISLRSFLSITGYVFFISCGVYLTSSFYLKNEKIIIGVVGAIYLISFLYFFFLYQTTIKFSSGDQWHMYEKVLINKLAEMNYKRKNQKVIVYVNEPRPTLLQYLYYEEKNPYVIKKLITGNNDTIGNIQFSHLCPQEKIPNSIQIMNSERCPVNEKVFKSEVLVAPEFGIGSKYLLLY